MAEADNYGRVLRRNISGARGRLQLSQAAVAARMSALGFDWHQQTAGAIEKGRRRVTAEEIHGLSRALETSIAALMRPSDDDKVVAFPSGDAVPAVSVQRSAGAGSNDGAVQWDGDVPKFFLQLLSDGGGTYSTVGPDGTVRAVAGHDEAE